MSVTKLDSKKVHVGLKSGKYRLIKFKEAHVKSGQYFVEDGMLVYIAGMDRIEKNRHGKKKQSHTLYLRKWYGIGHLYANAL